VKRAVFMQTLGSVDNADNILTTNFIEIVNYKGHS